MKFLESFGELFGLVLIIACTISGGLAFISFCLWVIKMTSWGL